MRHSPTPFTCRYVRVAAGALLFLLATLCVPSMAIGQPRTVTFGYLGLTGGVPVGYLGPDGGMNLKSFGLGSGQHSALKAVEMAVVEQNKLGRYYNVRFKLVHATGDTAPVLEKHLAEFHKLGVRFVVADLPAPLLVALADATQKSGMLMFNIAATDNALRNQQCARNLFHLVPSRAMLADALAQYLITRKWREWLIVSGPRAEDAAFVAALQRAARRYGGQIREVRTWKDNADMRRTAEAEFPLFTAKAEYHVVLVADEGNHFGEFLNHNIYLPRPVAGTQGLVAQGWFWGFAQWGATQLNARHIRATGQKMTSTDWAGWAAITALGEAVTQSGADSLENVRAHLTGDNAKIQGYKGVTLSFRPWNNQLRQPVILATPRARISVSPQPGFLHPTTTLDTLGFDRKERTCRF